MLRRSLVLLLVLRTGLAAQALVGLVGYGYTFPTPVYAAPGQLLTLLAHVSGNPGNGVVRASGGADLPTTLAGISLSYFDFLLNSPPPPILQVSTFLTSGNPLTFPGPAGLAAITIQLPFEAPTCPQCWQPGGSGNPSMGVLNVSANGGLSEIDVYVFADQIHILTTCDPLTTGSYYAPVNPSGLPCPSVVTHGDGSLVSAKNPAGAGEEIVAYAVGLGQTNPPLATGKLVKTAVPTQTTFALDFNYRPNALATKPAPGAQAPVFAGATSGYVGLYQINFVVPPVPLGTPACVEPATIVQAGQVVQSNLTVSVGGQFSFDGVRICVAVP